MVPLKQYGKNGSLGAGYFGMGVGMVNMTAWIVVRDKWRNKSVYLNGYKQYIKALSLPGDFVTPPPLHTHTPHNLEKTSGPEAVNTTTIGGVIVRHNWVRVWVGLIWDSRWQWIGEYLWGLGVYKVTQKNVLQSIVGYCENTWDFDRQLVHFISGLPIFRILY